MGPLTYAWRLKLPLPLATQLNPSVFKHVEVNHQSLFKMLNGNHKQIIFAQNEQCPLWYLYLQPAASKSQRTAAAAVCSIPLVTRRSSTIKLVFAVRGARCLITHLSLLFPALQCSISDEQGISSPSIGCTNYTQKSKYNVCLETLTHKKVTTAKFGPISSSTVAFCRTWAIKMLPITNLKVREYAIINCISMVLAISFLFFFVVHVRGMTQQKIKLNSYSVVAYVTIFSQVHNMQFFPQKYCNSPCKVRYG